MEHHTSPEILKTHIQHYDVICLDIEIILLYDVTLIYATYAKCGKIQMASSVACVLFTSQAFILSPI